MFDLDETLVKVFKTKQSRPSDTTAIVYTKAMGYTQLFIFFRPGLKEMLTQLMEHFELILFTAGQDDYAKAVVKAIY